MVPLLLGISLDIYVVTRLALPVSDPWLSIVLGMSAFVVLAGLWVVFPYWHLLHPHRRPKLDRMWRWFT